MKQLILFFICMKIVASQNVGPVITTSPQNRTVLITSVSQLTLHCAATGNSTVRYSWQKNGTFLYNFGSKYRILPSGTLKIRHLSLRDSGWYRCLASNRQGEVYSPYVLVLVQAPAEIVDGPKDRKVWWGTVVRLQCRTVGNPMPHILWQKNGIPVIDEDTGDTYTKSYILYNATETATFECEAFNKHVGGITRRRQIATVTVVEPARPPGYCSNYNGTICKKYIGSRSVFFNTSFENPEETNEKIVKGLWLEMIEPFDKLCRGPAEKMLCHYAFPDCDTSQEFDMPKPLCMETCLAVQDLYCFTEWKMIEDHKQKGIFYHNRGHFRLPNCTALPQYHKNNQSCIRIQWFEKKNKKFTSNCYFGNGQYYNGTKNITKSGKICQKWSSQLPHTHNRVPEVFEELQNAENYCRNPGGEVEHPWCYTVNKTLRWDYCDIPVCDENATSPASEGAQSPVMEPALPISTIYIIGALCGGVVLILVVFVATYFCVAVRRMDQKYHTPPQEDVEIDLNDIPANISYHRRSPIEMLHPHLETLEYPRNNILYMKDIGQGAFGRVFQAKAPHIVKGEELTLIAVKMLKEDATDDMRRDFEREASLMVDFDHPNIVRLIGVCAIGQPMCLLFEYMARGDLNDFLRTCSPDHFIVRRRSNEAMTNDVPKLDHIQQLEIAKQIAAGMVYLSERNFVHRDLATRNCLVGNEMVVKIADFGLARQIDSVIDFYKGDESDAIPIRWMPLETILYNQFSLRSDIWSFGVVLWEIFSFALQPYYGMTHEEVVQYVKAGKILSCPDNTPAEVYEIMKMCWSKKPDVRPLFPSLFRSICILQNNLSNMKKVDRL
ncbi:muscle, skeletal receptor tyrosine protein kinase [Lingula anatina]|uniref:receptor protein-tyrosine kinase n=1 Tax=Lingula anatina TaxID=7574 RepID=A0A1S3KD51_LINAN|nr:muscle, skeletal receptor tyrosine protein kinase [Lingula anatina]|eukprot:XP_013420550.1 muscle, skeletal receptor tyrosine protein kinase [Lingula anatina]